MKSPRTTVKKRLIAVTASMFNSKLLSCDWFGKRYKETNLHSLPPIVISKLKNEYQEFLREENFDNKY